VLSLVRVAESRQGSAFGEAAGRVRKQLVPEEVAVLRLVSPLGGLLCDAQHLLSHPAAGSDSEVARCGSGGNRLMGGSDVATVGQGVAVRGIPSGVLPPVVVPHPREELFSVLVADGHPLLREAVTARLTAMGAGTVHQAASVAEARARALASGPCDLAILDLGLPDGSGLNLVAELRAQGWGRLVVLASSDDPYLVRSAFQAGAQAYLLKSTSPRVVTDGVQRVLTGGALADPTVAPLLATGTWVPGTDNTPRELSVREVEVLELVADGRSNKEIGDTLGLSALTVKSHLSRIGRKLGTGDRAQMVALAMRAGVIR